MVDSEYIFTKDDIDAARNFGMRNSPCSRRKYGVMLIGNDGNRYFAANERVGRFCTNQMCVRDYRGAHHGERVELGGEIHAEQALVTKYGQFIDGGHVLIAGSYGNGEPFYSWNSIPCHVCGVMLKYAGVKNVWLASDMGIAFPVSIDGVLEYYEETL